MAIGTKCFDRMLTSYGIVIWVRSREVPVAKRPIVCARWSSA